jgi:hypothetical protein
MDHHVMSDLLNMKLINSLGQLYSRDVGDWDWWWPVYDIDVETGLFRIDVCGKLQAKHIGDVASFKDDSGRQFDPESFYLEAGQ